jgi:hypothetical protein
MLGIRKCGRHQYVSQSLINLLVSHNFHSNLLVKLSSPLLSSLFIEETTSQQLRHVNTLFHEG